MDQTSKTVLHRIQSNFSCAAVCSNFASCKLHQFDNFNVILWNYFKLLQMNIATWILQCCKITASSVKNQSQFFLQLCQSQTRCGHHDILMHLLGRQPPMSELFLSDRDSPKFPHGPPSQLLPCICQALLSTAEQVKQNSMLHKSGHVPSESDCLWATERKLAMIACCQYGFPQH